jgi:hypothetical protein
MLSSCHFQTETGSQDFVRTTSKTHPVLDQARLVPSSSATPPQLPGSPKEARIKICTPLVLDLCIFIIPYTPRCKEQEK